MLYSKSCVRPSCIVTESLPWIKRGIYSLDIPTEYLLLHQNNLLCAHQQRVSLVKKFEYSFLCKGRTFINVCHLFGSNGIIFGSRKIIFLFCTTSNYIHVKFSSAQFLVCVCASIKIAPLMNDPHSLKNKQKGKEKVIQL